MVAEKLPIAMLALLLYTDMFTRLTCLCYRLSFLPVTFLDLKNLKALWLCENQVSFDRVSRLLEINVLKYMFTLGYGVRYFDGMGQHTQIHERLTFAHPTHNMRC